MNLFLIVFAILALVSFLSLDKEISKNETLFLFFCFFSISLIAGLRTSGFQSDYENYKNIFYSFKGLFDGGFQQIFRKDYFFEPGFAILITLVATISTNHVVFFLIVALTTSTIMIFSIKRLSVRPLFPLLVFFSYSFFTNYIIAIRFGIASALGLIVLVSITKRKIIYTFILILIAMSFHTSAIILFIPFYLSINNFDIKRKHVAITILLSLLIGYYRIGSYIIDFLPSWIPRSDSALIYVNSSQYGDSLGYLGYINIKFLILSGLILLLWEKIYKEIRFFKEILFFMIGAIFLRIGFHDLGFIIGRTSAILGIVEIIFIPEIAFAFFKRKITAFILIFIYASIQISFFLLKEEHSLIL